LGALQLSETKQNQGIYNTHYPFHYHYPKGKAEYMSALQTLIR